MESIITFRTDRLIAERLRVEDLDELRRMHHDPRVMATLGGLRSDAAAMPRHSIAAGDAWRSALIAATQPLEVPAKHHQSSGLLAPLLGTRFTVWVSIIVVRTSLWPSHCAIVRIAACAWSQWLATLGRDVWAEAR
jgi:hypothetical protein